MSFLCNIQKAAFASRNGLKHVACRTSSLNFNQTKKHNSVVQSSVGNMDDDTGGFLYFGYGSNLLEERIHIQNPSARFVNIAKLQGYRLGFDYTSPRWHGSVASIFEAPGQHVWGVVWKMQAADKASLDDQEGVRTGVYAPIQVQVTSRGGEQQTCRSYQLLRLDSEDKRPSPQYLQVVLKGAKQHDLPPDYIASLELIEHNGFKGDVTFPDI